MNFESVRSIIDTYIKKNGVEAITGDILNNVLNTMLDDVDTAISSIEPSPGGGSGEGGVSEEDVLNILEKNNYITSSALSSYYTKSESDNRYLASSLLGSNTLIHSGNIGSQSVASAKSLVASDGTTYVSYNSTYGQVNVKGINIGYGGNTIERASSGKLYIQKNVTQDTILNQYGGYVGIGTDSPSTKLDVNGTVRVGTAGAGNELLRFNTDRPWAFYQVESGTSASLVLRCLENSKNFIIQTHNAGYIARFFADTNSSSVQIYTPLTVNGAVTMSSTLSVGGGATVSGTLNGTQIRLSNYIPLVFTNQGSGTYTQAVVEYTSSGFVFERARKTDSGSGEIIPLIISQRGGGAAVTFSGNDLIVAGDTSSGSDIRFKDVIKNKTLKIEHIAKAPLFTFKWNDREDDTIHLGSSAQYWENIAPWLVSGSDFKSLNYATLGVAMGISLAKKAVNHEERIKVLEKENKALKEEIRRMQYGS